MKKIYLVCAFMLISICIFSQKIQIETQQQNDQIANSQSFLDSIPLVISPGTQNVSVINNLETVLKSYSGVHYNSYCSNHNIFLLTVDKAQYATSQVFYIQLKSTTNIITLLLKEGDHKGIMAFCEITIPETIEEIDSKKALLDK